MKYEINVGDNVKVTKGKFSGKEAQVLFIDKKNNRLRLEGLKKQKVKTKKGSDKELHGTFHLTSLSLIKPEPPKEQPAAEEPKAQEAKPAEAAPETKTKEAPAAQESKAEVTKTEEPKKEAAAEEKTEEKPAEKNNAKDDESLAEKK